MPLTAATCLSILHSQACPAARDPPPHRPRPAANGCTCVPPASCALHGVRPSLSPRRSSQRCSARPRRRYVGSSSGSLSPASSACGQGRRVLRYGCCVTAEDGCCGMGVARPRKTVVAAWVLRDRGRRSLRHGCCVAAEGGRCGMGVAWQRLLRHGCCVTAAGGLCVKLTVCVRVECT
eukprot:208226-Chlamydomonas_euryale.AAC.1